MAKKKTTRKSTKKKAPTANSQPERKNPPNVSDVNPEQFQINEAIFNALMSRQDFLEKFLDDRRDIDDECGYPKTNNITAEHYRVLYDREPVAARVVNLWPKECWKVQPRVYETEDAETETAFEKAWKELDNSLRGDSLYQDEEGSPIWEMLQRADELSGVGFFGALFLGFDDGEEDVTQPVEPREGMKLLYMRAFDESLIQVTRYENDKTSPRFGLPVQYQLTLNDPSETHSGTGIPLSTLNVHWTRVIHLADNLGSSEVFGVPRMRPVYNRLYDLRKLYSGSAEMYWRGAFPGLSIESHPQLGADTSIDTSSARSSMTSYMEGLQRYMLLTGMSAKSLAPQVVDPSPQVEVQLTAIAIALNVPKRVLIGSERGELSSTQDRQSWNERVVGRQVSYLTPRVIVPFVDRLIQLGVLPTPEGFSVEWPGLESLTPDETVGIGAKAAEAIAKYIQGGGEQLILPIDFLTRYMGLSQEEAMAILEAVAEELPDDDHDHDEDVQEPEVVEDGETGQESAEG